MEDGCQKPHLTRLIRLSIDPSQSINSLHDEASGLSKCSCQLMTLSKIPHHRIRVNTKVFLHLLCSIWRKAVSRTFSSMTSMTLNSLIGQWLAWASMMPKKWPYTESLQGSFISATSSLRMIQQPKVTYQSVIYQWELLCSLKCSVVDCFCEAWRSKTKGVATSVSSESILILLRAGCTNEGWN